MKIVLKNHNYRYAVEQMISTLFPGEKPDYSSAPSDGRELSVSLSRGYIYTTAMCTFRNISADPAESVSRGRAAVKSAFLTDETETDRLCQFIIKNAVYRAVLSSGMTKPAWGALTGVRPGKLMTAVIRQSQSREAALSRFVSDYDVSRERAELCYETSLCTLKAEESLAGKDVCLYVGIPFCPTRCAYCSFVSQSVEKSMKLIGPFFSALKKEICSVAEQAANLGLKVVSVYFGGGTPTTLSAGQLDELCMLLYSAFDMSCLREFTVEAGRPDTIDEEKLSMLRKHGVDRISVNPQTMRDSVLETIGRRHTAQDVIDALSLVRKTGGFSVNMDIIAGLPGDDTDGFADTVEKVIALSPENITVHTLSLKRGSFLTLTRAAIPGPAEVGAMLDSAYAALRRSGYSPYYLYRQKSMSGGFENTGWTKEGYVNLYNICMMEEIYSVLAAGGGGSTKLISPGGGKNIRITAPKYPLEYIEQIDKTCSDKERIGEFYEL